MTSAAQLKLSRTFDLNLEALRGFAAMLVVWHHIIEHQHWLDPHYMPSGFFSFNPPGRLSVMVFFVLSGYVIGRTHIVPLSRNDIIPYLKKRFSRLYPIYFISIVVALLVAKNSYPATTIVSNLAMTQNILTPTIFEINPIWSLNFEVLFYLAFIPLSFLRINIYLVASLFVGIGLLANTQTHYLIGGYCLGFTFWLCGVMLARNLQRPCAPSFSVMASLLLLLLALRDFNVLTIWLSKQPYLLHRPDIFDTGPVRIADLSSLPYCVLMVALFASLDFPYRKYILPLFLLLPIIAIYKKLHIPGYLQDKTIILPLIFYIAALAIYFLRNPLEAACRRFVHRLSGTGAWSYGLYIIHFPIIAVFARIDWFAGTALTFSVRLLCYALCCWAAAYFLEKKFQPWAKKLLY